MEQSATILNNCETDYACQKQLLPGVSRTFALTIPELPEPLCSVVTNAYLLCRIADTIEDDDNLSTTEKANFHEQFRQVLAAKMSVQIFAERLYENLSKNTSPDEKNLIQNLPAVIRCLQSFSREQQTSLCRCVNIMSTGMPHYQREVSLAGLPNVEELDRYCYYVAGVVGEMLTELFCQYSQTIEAKRSQLTEFAVSFGQGLQMTNILKDFWDDRSRGVCWLPRDVFNQVGIDLKTWQPGSQEAEFAKAMRHLVSIACGHLENALHYTSLIPVEQTGIRRFALWAISLAVLTLRNLYKNPNFRSGQEIKVKRRTVKLTILVCNLCAERDSLLKFIFKKLTKEMRYEGKF